MVINTVEGYELLRYLGWNYTVSCTVLRKMGEDFVVVTWIRVRKSNSVHNVVILYK